MYIYIYLYIYIYVYIYIYIISLGDSFLECWGPFQSNLQDRMLRLDLMQPVTKYATASMLSFM